MCYYIIIRGPLGVGKTSVSKKLAKLLNAHYVSMDKILDKHKLAVYDHYYHTIPRRNYLKANKVILPEVKKQLQKGRNVIFDGCFYYKEQIEDLINNLKDPYYVFTLKAPLKTCISRDSRRKKVYGKDAAKAVHNLVSRFDYGNVINISEQKIEQTVREILNCLITVRNLKSSDVPRVAKIAKGEKAVEDYPGEYSAEVFRGLVKNKTSTTLVAEQNKKPVGFIEFTNDKIAKRLFIWAIAISKKHRGQGIGSLLIKKAEEIAKKSKSIRVGFAVKDWNKPMQKLAKKSGYSVICKHIFYDKKI